MPPVPVAQWGRDHWSTFAYIETRIVDHRGVVHNQHMRCHPRLHRAFAHEGSRGPLAPTRLAGGEELAQHDDWSCAEDAIAAGLLTVDERVPGAPVFALTDRGHTAAAALRRHKAGGGNFGNFTWDDRGVAG